MTTLSDKRGKRTSTMIRERCWYTLCPKHYASADSRYLPRWAHPEDKP